MTKPSNCGRVTAKSRLHKRLQEATRIGKKRMGGGGVGPDWGERPGAPPLKMSGQGSAHYRVLIATVTFLANFVPA